jgi:hypothetical protein
MRSTGPETQDLANRRQVRLFIMLAGLLLLAAVARVASAGECRAYDPMSGEDLAVQSYPSVERSIPGWWRQQLKLQLPFLRVPGTNTIMPRTPAPAEVNTEGRWLAGYRPATPQALAAFEAWKAQQNSARAGIEGADLPRAPSSNYGANLFSGERATDVPDETITHAVRSEQYEISPIAINEIRARIEAPREKGPGDGYHHGSGLTWNEYLLLKELAQSAPPTLEGQEAFPASGRAPTAGGVAFDAIQSNGTSVPPDAIMAAGPNHLIALVNRRYQVWDKTGAALISAIPLDDFFSGVDNCNGVFDVFVDYDEALDRFVMGGMALFTVSGTDSYLCLAATATGDPTGVWNRAGFRADANVPGTWIDYPHMGIGLDEIYIAGNMFVDGGGLDHVRAFAVDKSALYAGTSISVAEASLSSLFFTAQPVKIHGYVSGGWPAPGTPHHFIAHDGGGNSRIWRWSTPFTTAPVIYGTIAEANFGGIPPSAPELGGSVGNLNDTGSAKWLDAEYRNGKLWTTRNTACDFGGGSTESCIDWIQVDLSGPSPVLEQQQSGGAYGSADDFRYYPDLSVDRNNNIAIGYTKSSDSTYTEVWVTGREFDDASGTLQAESLQRAGLGNYSDGAGCLGGCDRWGDYTGMTVDPDGCTFWYLGQYSDGGYFNWGTHIGSFKFDSCSVDSSLQVDKATYTCDDSMTVTVTDSTMISAATVSAQTTIFTSGGDSETISAGSWSGSDCSGGDCSSWTATLTVSGAAGSSGDGTLNVNNGETITATYLDPHGGHSDQTRNVAVGCATRFDDGGYIIDGGCAPGEDGEFYRDYMDGGEYIVYNFGIFNPATAPALTDVSVTLSVSGPASDKVTIFNPTVAIGPMTRDSLTGAIFQIYIDPTIDASGFRMSEHDFNLSVISPADGFTYPQVLTQTHLLHADDNIVTESQCWNFESGDQGFVHDSTSWSYECDTPQGCSTYQYVSTTVAPWTHGRGCGSETRDDYPEMTCDTAGTNAFKTNSDLAACNLFDQSATTITDDVLYSPIFGPANAGNAANGQPWYYNWSYAEWFYDSDMFSGEDMAMGVGFFWDDEYLGVATPGINEVWSSYPLFYGYFGYVNQNWDSATPWDPAAPPANIDGLGFGLAANGEAIPGLQWRWGVEAYDADMGGDPEATPATNGLALDNMNLVYEQYHADEQFGTCADSAAIVTIDQFIHQQCPSSQFEVSVLDINASGSVRVTVTAQETGDVETFTIYGSGPRFAASLDYSTAGGSMPHDGTLFVAPSDVAIARYGDEAAITYINCQGGEVVADGVVAINDNGDGDSYADTNETVDISVRIRNNSDTPLSNVTAIIASDDPMVDCITDDSAYFGSIAAGGGTASNDLVLDPFTFKVANSAECADPLSPPVATFQLLIMADDFAGPLTPQKFTMILDMNDIPGTITFNENFTTEPAGFNHRVGPGDDDGAAYSPESAPCSPYVDEFFWRSTGGNTGGGYFCWDDPADSFPGGTYSDLNDSTLYSPVLKIGAASTTLSFDHEYLFGWTGTYRVDGARVDYSVNGGVWQKLTTLPYDGGLIWNTYCNPLCNGSELGAPCYSETAELGESVFNQLDQGTVNWTNASGALSGLTTGDLVQFRWRVGSMNTSLYGISTAGGYGLDNVSVTNVIQQVCDSATNLDAGCGVIYDSSGNLTQICGDDDAIVEPSERWSIDVSLRNSSVADAVNATADLVPSGGSPVLATVTNNPGSYGTLPALGGTGTASYQFVVDSNAVCINDILFNVENIADGGGGYGDQPSAFTIQVGGIGSQEIATQSVDPLDISDGTVASALSPAFTTPAPAYSATVTYDSNYTNTVPLESSTQDTDPLAVENTILTTTLSAPLTLDPATAVTATLDWTSFTHSDITDCARLYIRTPLGLSITLKAQGEAPANPYDVLYIYRHANGGTGQYTLGVEEYGGGCKNAATLSGATMTVTGPTTTGSWGNNARVLLWDGTTEYVLKGFGTPDTGNYDVTSIYNAGGPGTYELRLVESSGGGTASLTAGTMTVEAVQCDQGCTSIATPAPPMADGYYGSGVTMSKGAGANEIVFSIDSATCSGNHAIVLYGDIGDYGSYQGAVDLGCNIGSGPTATVTHAGGNVWFNVLWVNDDDAAGHPGYDSSGSRSWSATGLCGAASDDPADATCD